MRSLCGVHSSQDHLLVNSPNTAHSLNPAPFVLVTEDSVQLNSGILADVTPSILDRMQIAAPLEMTGKSLVVLP